MVYTFRISYILDLALHPNVYAGPLFTSNLYPPPFDIVLPCESHNTAAAPPNTAINPPAICGISSTPAAPVDLAAAVVAGAGVIEAPLPAFVDVPAQIARADSTCGSKVVTGHNEDQQLLNLLAPFTAEVLGISYLDAEVARGQAHPRRSPTADPAHIPMLETMAPAQPR